MTEINISDCRGVHDDGVSSLASHCPSLQKYTAYRCKQLGDDSLSALATHCPLLVKVHVGNQDKLTDESLKKVWLEVVLVRDWVIVIVQRAQYPLYNLLFQQYLQNEYNIFVVHFLNANFALIFSF